MRVAPAGDILSTGEHSQQACCLWRPAPIMLRSSLEVALPELAPKTLTGSRQTRQAGGQGAAQA